MARSLDTLSGLRVGRGGQARGWIYPGGGQINLARITRPSLSYSLKYFTRTTTRIFLSGETLPPSPPPRQSLSFPIRVRGPPSQHRSRGLIMLERTWWRRRRRRRTIMGQGNWGERRKGVGREIRKGRGLERIVKGKRRLRKLRKNRKMEGKERLGYFVDRSVYFIRVWI